MKTLITFVYQTETDQKELRWEESVIVESEEPVNTTMLEDLVATQIQQTRKSPVVLGHGETVRTVMNESNYKWHYFFEPETIDTAKVVYVKD